jgi:amidophosphoribosyltransferase
MPAGVPFMFRERNIKANPLDLIFRELLEQYNGKVADGTDSSGVSRRR